MFAAYHDAARHGGSIVTLSASADPTVSPLATSALHEDEQRLSRWTELSAGSKRKGEGEGER